jgi:hypothetical protein
MFNGQKKIRLLGREAAHYRHLVPRLRMNGAVPLILRYYFMAHRDNFTFFGGDVMCFV